MDSASDAERAVQLFVVQPSLLRRREPDPDWICPPELDLGWDVDALEEDELYVFLSEVDLPQIESLVALPSTDHEPAPLPVQQGVGNVCNSKVNNYGYFLYPGDDSSADRFLC